MQEITVKEENIKQRLDVYLTSFFENKFTRNQINSCIENSLFLINSKKTKNSYKLKQQDVISFDKDEIEKFLNPTSNLEKWDYKLDILFEDDDLLVINKPKNMLTHPTKFDNKNTLVNALMAHCNNLSDLSGNDRKGIVHRLDKNTSGLILACKTNFAHENLALQIKEKTARRKYLAIIIGHLKEKEGVINKPLAHYIKDNVKMIVDENGLNAITCYKVLEEYKYLSLIELELKTGRTHQIRAHLSYLKHPIFGDSLYGAKGYLKQDLHKLKTQEQLLQSYYISFTHPRTKEIMEFQLKEEDFSKDFQKTLKILRSEKCN